MFKKYKCLLIVFLLFFSINFNTYALAIYGSFVVMPMNITNQWAVVGGAAITLSFDNWIFSLGSYNDIIRNVKARFTYDLLDEKPYTPRLINNFFELEAGKQFPLSKDIGFLATGKFGLNDVKYRVILSQTEFLALDNLPDFGRKWYFTLAPSCGAYYDIGNWIRFSTVVAYRFSLGANYIVKNIEDISLLDKDLSGLAILFQFQFGDIRE